jgi:hypothetical protein
MSKSNNPTISISSPASNVTFSAQTGKNTITLSGTICDPDVGDVESIYYRIDGSAGQVGTQHGSTITADNTNQPFSGSINVSSSSEGSHALYTWVQDNNGGQSTETAIPFNMDKTAPTINAPTLTATSTSVIIVQPDATDQVSNGVSTGLHTTAPFLYNRNGTYIGTWQSGSLSDSGLSPNTQYTYKYKAMDNVLNTSGYSTTSGIYTLAITPSINLNNATPYTLDVNVSDSNPANTQYQIWTGSNYVCQTGTLTLTPTWITLTGQKITVTGLTPDTLYTFTAKARNASNVETSNSNAPSGTTLFIPLTPANLSSDTLGDKINVSWNASSGATGYDLWVDGSTVDMGNTTSYQHTGVVAYSSHTYKIRAKNANGISGWSGDISAKPKYKKYSINAINNNNYIVFFTGNNIKTFTGVTFKVIYDPAQLDVLDINTATVANELTVGAITGTNMTVTQFIPGVIVFTLNKTVAPGKPWVGVFDAVKFKAKTTGKIHVTFITQ